ncbi:MAG: sensor histidine kinase [Streptosporangiaceae bacterium]
MPVPQTLLSNEMPLLHLDSRGRRLLPAVTVLPYVILGLLALYTVVVKHGTGESLLIDLALCALAAAWMLWMFTLHPAWRLRQRPMAVFWAGLYVVMAVLVVRDPWFGFLTLPGYLYTFAVLRWPWRLGGVAAIAILAGTAQSYGVNMGTPLGLIIYLAVLAANVVPMCGLAWSDYQGDIQGDERKQAMTELSAANRRLEATLAENAGLHEQLLTQAREAGILDERQRMAREIHDTLAQGLTGIITQLQAAEQAREEPAEWERHFAAAAGLARESLTEARRSVDALRPEPLEAARLSDALADVAERWTALHGIPVQVTTTGTARPVRPEAEFVLLRTAQEALANVARHARASTVALTLSYLEQAVALDVRDDGRGFVPAGVGTAAVSVGVAGGPLPVGPRPEGGFGLVAMRERIEGVSGTLEIESEPGAGTVISACVPARPAAGCPA